MKISQSGLDLIKKFEGLRLKAYLDVAGVPTIGYGTIQYPTGVNVKLGDQIDEKQAEEFLRFEVEKKTAELDKLVSVNQNQFDALASFCYNVGMGAFKGATLCRRVRFNPNDPIIRDQFLKWNKARINGVLQPVKGLTLRRQAESDLYFKSTI